MIFRKDYKRPQYQINTVDLEFTLHPTETAVHSVIKGEKKCPGTLLLDLNGKYFTLKNISLNGEILSSADYEKKENAIQLKILSDTFEIECDTIVNPKDNTSLSGLYLSNGIFCTQCEAEGFRNITYFPDHPDIMAKWTTTIHADRRKYPILLSNGNKIKDAGDTVVWEDPFPKPSYLFALVAGDLAYLSDTFTTCSGREVALKVFCEKEKKNRLTYALGALKRAMKWDEEAFDREYDLDLFNIVAVSDFNAGAMENKSLNIFNDSCLLADIDTETDREFEYIEEVVGHEYFHNWSGDRVTARDWFNLSLKEGFTVYRDQEFSASLHSKTVKRIDDVLVLKQAQYPEDDGPLAHPVRPESYETIDNFYTATVYEKGAELIRMQARILGEENFKKACNLYFSRYDGQAVSIDEFVSCMQEMTPVDLKPFMNWYSVAGRPSIKVKQKYNHKAHTFTVTLTQKTKNTDAIFMIPLEYALFSEDGEEMQSGLWIFDKKEQTFTFDDVREKPVLSLNRSFTAPVDIQIERTEQERQVLIEHETDDFNRFEEGQAFATEVLLKLSDKADASLTKSFGSYLENYKKDKAFTARAIALPSESFLKNQMKLIDVEKIHAVREAQRLDFAQTYKEVLQRIYREEDEISSNKSLEVNESRALKNIALGYLTLLDHGELAEKQYLSAQNMTDRLTALALLMAYDYEGKGKKASELFYERYKNDHLVLNKWLSLQGSTFRQNALEEVKKLTQSDCFDYKNPNKVRALLGGFLGNRAFHATDGSGYDFLADTVLYLDKLNPQMASRMVVPLTQYKRYRQSDLMKKALVKVSDSPRLSVNVRETVDRALK